MKTLIIMTGPQGSGNHLFSKIFASLPGVFGWYDLTTKYWIAHDNEPFAEAWHNPSLLKTIDWEDNTFAVTSISCPYAYHRTTTTPNYVAFIDEAKQLKMNVKIAIIGRDQNILKYQQERVRMTHSYPVFAKEIYNLLPYNPSFISTELLYLYKQHYVQGLMRQFGIPNLLTDAQLISVISPILETDPNFKYFAPAPEQELDKEVRLVSGLR